MPTRDDRDKIKDVPRIFLCHVGEDKSRVQTLYQQLKKAGYAPWLDKEDLLPGQYWRTEIQKIISDPHNLVMVCLSRNSIDKRGVVQQEIKWALDILEQMPEDNIYLIPARLEECETPRQLADLHWVDLFEPDGFEYLKRSLNYAYEQLARRRPEAKILQEEHPSSSDMEIPSEDTEEIRNDKEPKPPNQAELPKTLKEKLGGVLSYSGWQGIAGIVAVLTLCWAVFTYGSPTLGSNPTPTVAPTATNTSTPTSTPTVTATLTPRPISTTASTNVSTATATYTPIPALAGKISYVSSSNNGDEIFSQNIDGSDRRKIATGFDPTWSTHGQRIAFAPKQGVIAVINSNGTDYRELTDQMDWQPDWSPDGQKIVFMSERNDNRQIYVMDEKGHNQIRLTDNIHHDRHPAWSPDGTKIAFISNRSGQWNIWKMNADGSNQTRITNTSGSQAYFKPTWSPDGSRIVFGVWTGNRNEIWIMNADGTNARPLITEFVYKQEGSGYGLSWAPNNWIAFISTIDNNPEIYAIRANGTHLTRITNNQVVDHSPVWLD